VSKLQRITAPTAQDYRAAATLREVLRLFARRTELITRSHGLTPRSYQLLLMIKTGRRRTGRAELRELEERLQLGKSTVTELVLRTEDAGLVRRELDRNRRGAISVRLTAAGDRRLAKVVADLGDERVRLLELLASSPLGSSDDNSGRAAP
jgi:DNA-binding MarR family transcriptional regulator